MDPSVRLNQQKYMCMVQNGPNTKLQDICWTHYLPKRQTTAYQTTSFILIFKKNRNRKTYNLLIMIY